MSKKKSEALKPLPSSRRRPETMAEMREMMSEMWALIWEERCIRAEEAKAHAEARAKADEERAKADEERAKANAKADEERAKANAKANEERAKLDAAAKREMAELRRTVRSLGKSTGDFMENSGRILERGVVARMKRNGGIGQVKGKVFGSLKKEREYDGAVVNGQETVVLEVKRNLRLSDVEKFLHRLPRFARDFPDLAEGRKIYGALAFELDADKGEALKLARENGLMLVQVSDKKGMKVLNPDPAQLRPVAA